MLCQFFGAGQDRNDSAKTESFFRTLKVALFQGSVYNIREEVKMVFISLKYFMIGNSAIPTAAIALG
jgi:hypothetical protein